MKENDTKKPEGVTIYIDRDKNHLFLSVIMMVSYLLEEDIEWIKESNNQSTTTAVDVI